MGGRISPSVRLVIVRIVPVIILLIVMAGIGPALGLNKTYAVGLGLIAAILSRFGLVWVLRDGDTQ